MKRALLLSFSVAVFNSSHSQIISAGLDLRTYPIDIEDVPLGPSHADASFYSGRIWKPLSFRWNIRRELSKNWNIQFSNIIRYNHTNWKTGINFNLPTQPKRSEAKSFKYDFILDVEKRMNLFHSKKDNFSVQIGVGVVNLNSNFDVKIRDTFPSGLSDLRYYKGSFLNVAPHLGVGYKIGKIKIIVDFFIVEGPTFQNLSSLWMGSGIMCDLSRN